MANIKHSRNQLLNEIGAAVAALRNALQIAEENEWDELYELEETIEELINLSNLAEQIT